MLRDFATHQLSTLPDLLSQDVPRARAELSRHVTGITMTPAGSEGQRHSCQGNWDLLGTLTGAGDVRMVAGGWISTTDLWVMSPRRLVFSTTYKKLRSVASYLIEELPHPVLLGLCTQNSFDSQPTFAIQSVA